MKPQHTDPVSTDSSMLKRLDVRVRGLDCESEATQIRRGFEELTGLHELRINPGAAKVSVAYDPELTSDREILDQLEKLGFEPVRGSAAPETPRLWRNPKVVTSVAAGLLTLGAWLLDASGAPGLVPVGLYLAAILIGGYYFGREGIEELIFERRVGIELLMTIAAVTAAALGAFGEAAILVFLYSISEALEGYTEEKTRSAIRALMDLAPKQALVRRDGVEKQVPVEDLQTGDVFLVRPGEGVATDGEVVRGRSSVNQAPVTGESLPVEKVEGDDVFAGSINGEGFLEVRATKAFAQNTISRIIQMVEEAEERKGRSQRFIERFGVRYSPAVLLLGVAVALVPSLAFGSDWTTWVTRATVFIVAAAPCALVISIPITLVASLGTGARKGVLIKGGVYLEELAKVRVVALDKTGTITRGEPDVTDIVPLGDGRTPNDVLALAAGIERRSEHPLARAIVRRARERNTDPIEITDFRALTGAGATGTIDGLAVRIGSPSLWRERLGTGPDGTTEAVGRLEEEGKTVVLVGDEGTIWGLIAIRDNVRPNAAKAIRDLHAAGIRAVAMLTGDNERTAKAIAREVGIDQVHAGLKPEDKVARIRDLTERHGHLAMVGDGVNDAPALAEATVGVAMGAAGTDVALETADVALMADDLEKLVYAVKLARKNQRVIRQNLALSVAVIATLVVGAVAGTFGLPAAVLGHEISELIVIGSGLRMLRA